MSAFFVSEKTINEAATLIKLCTTTPLDMNLVGVDMWTLNANSLFQRYADPVEEVQPMIDAYEYVASEAPVEEMFSSLRSWLYQCAEGNIPETSALWKACDQLVTMIEEKGLPFLNFSIDGTARIA
jgi:hypothetical protein